MRALRTLTSAAVLAASLAAIPASAAAQTTTTYEYHVVGIETYATSTKGVFAGTASGSAAGTWYAEVKHEVLDPHGNITGGSFGLLLSTAALAHTVSGQFSGGFIKQTNPGANCTKQVYSVNGDLKPVSAGGRTGIGGVDVQLTHHRKRFLGRCWTYAATVTGKVTLTV